MSSPRMARTRPWRPRFTLGGVMIVIALIALVFAALRPVASVMQEVYPDLARWIEREANLTNGVLLSCLVLGGYVTLRLMSLDEP